MTPTELRVLCAIGRFTSEDGTGVWASAKTLAEVADVHVAHLRRAVNGLVKRGYVRREYRRRENGSQDTNLLAIILDPPYAESAYPPLAESASPPYAESASPPYAESASQTSYHNVPSERPHNSLAEQRERDKSNVKAPVNDSQTMSAHTEAVTEAVTETKEETPTTTAGGDLWPEIWSRYPRRAGGNSRAAAQRAFQARIRSGVAPEDMLAGVLRYGAFCRATGKEGTEFVKQGSTFFGPNEHWNEPWNIPAGKGEQRATGNHAILNDFLESA